MKREEREGGEAERFILREKKRGREAGREGGGGEVDGM